ncbi:hypothetical protein GL303_20470 [Nocardia seriolae]|uniref:Imm51 family immunity protein n=1 Tax=Nocardia seriolae TaxID=37332 RepID=UPI00144F41E7|nr:Imm51 family immunity protein [Nocardia seriolae]MTK48855.1 hypothetical protein [Nocardia seriolae]
MTDRETFAPLVFFEYDHKPGHYCLMLSDNHMLPTEPVFAEFGYDAGGYGWAGVARSALTTQDPGLADRLNFDPEAGMFVAHVVRLTASADEYASLPARFPSGRDCHPGRVRRLRRWRPLVR